MKSSASVGSLIVQSASLPGSEEFSRALLRRVSSRAFRAAWRARAAETAFVMIWRASVGVLLQELREPLVHRGLHETLDRRDCRASSSSALRTAGSELHGDDGRQPFADVLAFEVVFLLLEQALLARVAVERPRQRALEALDRCVPPSVVLMLFAKENTDSTYELFHCIATSTCAVLALALEVDDVLVHRVLGLVDMSDEVADPTLVVGTRRAAAGSLVAKDDAQPARQEGRLAQALEQRRSVQLGLLEDLRVGKERDRRARLALGRDAGRLDLRRGLSARELLAVHLSVTPHLGHEPLGERVDDGDTDAVEAARHLVAVAAELPSGVELRQHDRQRRQPLVGDDVHRDARAGVAHRHRVVRMNRHVDEVVTTGERLVDGVVDHLVDEVMEASRARRADVHAGSQADRLEAFEDRDVFCGVGCFCH